MSLHVGNSIMNAAIYCWMIRHHTVNGKCFNKKQNNPVSQRWKCYTEVQYYKHRSVLDRKFAQKLVGNQTGRVIALTREGSNKQTNKHYKHTVHLHCFRSASLPIKDLSNKVAAEMIYCIFLASPIFSLWYNEKGMLEFLYQRLIIRSWLSFSHYIGVLFSSLVCVWCNYVTNLNKHFLDSFYHYI